MRARLIFAAFVVAAGLAALATPSRPPAAVAPDGPRFVRLTDYPIQRERTAPHRGGRLVPDGTAREVATALVRLVWDAPHPMGPRTGDVPMALPPMDRLRLLALGMWRANCGEHAGIVLDLARAHGLTGRIVRHVFAEGDGHLLLAIEDERGAWFEVDPYHGTVDGEPVVTTSAKHGPRPAVQVTLGPPEGAGIVYVSR